MMGNRSRLGDRRTELVPFNERTEQVPFYNRQSVLRNRIGVWLATLLIVQATAFAQQEPPALVILPGESRGAALQLDEIRKQIAQERWDEALQGLEELIDKPDALAPLSAEHNLQARQLAQATLATLPADVLRTWRERIEPRIGPTLEQGLKDRDEALLRKIVATAFCTRPAQKALDMLGELAFERGDFGEAISWWIRLVEPPHKEDPGVDVARVRAKILLGEIFLALVEGRTPPEDRLAAYRQAHADAAGKLAGQEGKYADILDNLGRKLEAPREASWLTFAGSPSRLRVVERNLFRSQGERNKFRSTSGNPQSEVLDRLSEVCRQPSWCWDLETHRPREYRRLRLAREDADLASSLAFYPLIVNRQALVSDARRLLACDLTTGECRVVFDSVRDVGKVNPPDRLPAPDGTRFTLTAGEGFILLRHGLLGVRSIRPGFDPEDNLDPLTRESILTCLDEDFRVRWYARASTLDFSVFEGAPLIHQGRVYIAATRIKGERAFTAVHCYAASFQGTEQQPLWTREVCETREQPGEEVRHAHHLLTLAGPVVVHASHSGAIVALDSITGERIWSRRYDGSPRPNRSALPGNEHVPPLSDLAPPVLADGKLYVAPVDSEQIFCLEPLTGKEIWRRDRIQVVHLLGVGEGRLIFTTPNGLRALDAATGSDEGGWHLPDSAGRLPPFGRGLLVGDVVLWPTIRGFYPIRQEDGRVADNPALLHNLPPGNLACAEGCVLSTDQTTMTAFVPPAWLLEKRQLEIGARPQSAEARIALAQAQADAGKTDDARASLQSARELVKKPTPALLHAQHHFLLTSARHALARGQPDEAARAFCEARGDAFAPSQRYRAISEAIHTFAAVDKPDEVKAARQTLAGDPVLASLLIVDDAGPQRASSRLADTPVGQAPRLPQETETGETPAHRTIDLNPGEQMLLSPEGVHDVVVTSAPGDTGATIRLRDSDGDTPRWETPIHFAPAWRDLDEGVVVVAGEAGAAGLDVRNGDLLWELLDPGWADRGRTMVRPRPLGTFRLREGKLFCLWDGELLAVDARTGRVLWSHSPPGAALNLPGRGKVFPALAFGDKSLLIQRPGQRLLLDRQSGRVLHQEPDGVEPWPTPPGVAAGRAVVQRGHALACIDLTTGAEVWKHALPDETLLTGSPVELHLHETKLVALVPTNVGIRLECLDARTGKSAWSVLGINPGELKERPSGWALGARAFYLVEGNWLTARSLEDGKRVWRQAIEPGEWRLVSRSGTVLAWRSSFGETSFQFRWLGGMVQWDLRMSPEDLRRGCPLLVHDARTGEQIARVDLPADRTRLKRKAGGGPFALLPKLHQEHRPTGRGTRVQITSRGAMVQTGDRLWKVDW